MKTEPKQNIVSVGDWLYEGTEPRKVYIFELNYDYWYEMERVDGELKMGEMPNLNEDGIAYYVRLKPLLGESPFGVDSPTMHSVADAQKWAETQIGLPVNWQK